ncbi:exported hypothetical protein [Halomonas sp. A3H3]|nr:exported hypothetical protein [Halomonas sp. A3H3]
MARANRLSGTMRIARAAAIDQNPPKAIPSSTRAKIKTKKLFAVAAKTLETTSSSDKPSSTNLRSKLRVRSGIVSAASAATAAVAVTAWPVAPTEMLRSAAMAVSRLAGKNSAVTKPKTPSARLTMPIQLAEVGSAVGVAVSNDGLAEQVVSFIAGLLKC